MDETTRNEPEQRPKVSVVQDYAQRSGGDNDRLPWLLKLFLLLTVGGSLVGAGMFAWSLASGQIFFSDSLPANLLVGITVVMVLFLLAFSGYLLYCFAVRASNAVAVGKLYLIFLFCTSLLALLTAVLFQSGAEEIKSALVKVGRQAMWCGGWFAYLHLAVGDYFPPEERTVLLRDKIWFGVAVGLIPLYLLISVVILFLVS